MCQGLRSVFLPYSAQQYEPSHNWQLPLVALILVVWLVGSLVLAVRTFR